MASRDAQEPSLHAADPSIVRPCEQHGGVLAGSVSSHPAAAECASHTPTLETGAPCAAGSAPSAPMTDQGARSPRAADSMPASSLERDERARRIASRLPSSAIRLPAFGEAVSRPNAGSSVDATATKASLPSAGDDGLGNSREEQGTTCSEPDLHRVPENDQVEVCVGGRGILRPRSYQRHAPQRCGLPGMAPETAARPDHTARNELEEALARQRARLAEPDASGDIHGRHAG
jgi:hypothetical protein